MPQHGCWKWSSGNQGAGMEGRSSHSLDPGRRVRATNKPAVWFALFATITWIWLHLEGEEKTKIHYKAILVVTVYSIQNFFVKLFLKQ